MAKETNPYPIKTACIQLCSGLNRKANVAQTSALIREAAEAGATFIATPEMTNVVDRKPDRLFIDLPHEADLPEIEDFSNLARETKTWILIGSMAVLAETSSPGDDKKKAANRSYLFAPDGSIAARYDKIHMFDVALPNGETWHESAVYEPGTTAQLATTSFGILGLSICYDLRFPGLYRELSRNGAEILCIPAAFTRQTGLAHWEMLLRSRAIECGAFVIAPAQGGDHEDGRETWGRSLIIDPWGEIIGQSLDDKPGIILADLDLSIVQKVRQRIPSLSAGQSFTLTRS